MSDPVARLNAALQGRYAIERELGEGGMATVYLADDIKHERKVALKVLKPELAAVVGAERFLAEIKTTANLQHPNILPLFDSGEADSYVFYVMPYVEGESLRDKLDREHQLPVDEAVRIASEVAEALQAAHEQGVVHRDIKPANILLSRGRPLLADFGIALAVSSAGGTRLTETGLSVGTPHYMSPEQAVGDRTTGPSTDIYALGCVLYETLVGEAPYTGTTAQAILGRIITGEPVSATKHRPSVPANVDAAVRKALEKLPADRFGSAQGLVQALADPGFRHTVVGGDEPAEVEPRPLSRRALPWGLTAVLAVTLVVLTSRPPVQPAPEVVRFTVPIAQGDTTYLGGPFTWNWGVPVSTSVAMSPAGDLLVYAARGGPDAPLTDGRLYSRRFDQDVAEPIAGTEGAQSPFFSPDGAWIGFFVEASLKRVSMVDGTLETIVAEAPLGEGNPSGDPGSGPPLGATWGDDGTIVFSGAGLLYRVAATGGEPELFAEGLLPGAGDSVFYRRPEILPGSQAILLQAIPSQSRDPEDAEIVALDLAGGTRRTVLTDAMDPRYVQTGHLLFVRQGTLMAVRFDPNRLEVQGQPVIMIEDVMHAVLMPNGQSETHAAQVAVSGSGHLAYARGGIFPEERNRVVRITSAGDTVPLEMDGRDYLSLMVSPDGSRLAFMAFEGSGLRLGVHDLGRGVTQLLNGLSDEHPIWSPDGQSLAVYSNDDGHMYRRAADGSGEPERLAPSDRSQYPSSWSSQGVIAFLSEESPESGESDIWLLPPGEEPAPFFTSGSVEWGPTFSPDGRWLAYSSDESGRREVYVRPYPGPEPATQISGDGGLNAAWSPDGRQIYYVQDMEGPRPWVLMSVDVTPGDELQAGRPVPLIDSWIFGMQGVRGYDVFPDGSFATYTADIRPYLEQHGVTELHVVLNWFEELKERVGN